MGGLFTKDNVLEKNPDDSNADLYSILGRLDHFKIKNNFHFRLCYPELKGLNDRNCNDWVQSSNPVTSSTISGFQSISLAFDKNSYLKEWAGLGKNVPGLGENTLIDDAPSDPNYFSAVGAFSYWPTAPYIPGPRLAANYTNSTVTKVNLHAYSEGQNIVVTTSGYNYQYFPYFCSLTRERGK